MRAALLAYHMKRLGTTPAAGCINPNKPSHVEERVMMPDLLGYQQVRLGDRPDELVMGWRLLERFAVAEGFALTQVFVDRDLNRPLSALGVLIQTARRLEVSAVAVPSGRDLGSTPEVARELRSRLEREAGVRVLVVEGRKVSRRMVGGRR